MINHAVWLYHVFSLSLPDVELILANAGFAVTGRYAEGNENGTPGLLIGGVKLFIQGRFQEAVAGRAKGDGAAPRQLRSLHVAQKRLISSNAVVFWDRRSTIVKARIVPINVVVLALAVGACSTGEPCVGPYGEPCGGPRSGWPGAVTCPSC